MRSSIIVCLFLACTALSAQEDVLRPNGRPEGSSPSSASSRTETRFVLGIEGGLNLNFYGADYSSAPTIENSPDQVLESGFGLSPEFGVFADIPLSNIIGIQIRAAYDGKWVSNTQSGILEAAIQGAEPPEAEGFVVADVPVDASYNLQLNTMAFALLFRIDIVDQLFATLGPIATVQIGDATRTDEIVATDLEQGHIAVDYEGNPGEFEQIEREISVSTNILPTPSGNFVPVAYTSTRFGLELGVGYRFHLSNSVYLAPNVRYQYFFTEQNPEYMGVDLSHAFSAGPVNSSYGASSLNTLAIILQLGFEL